jgi:hypothetical protein
MKSHRAEPLVEQQWSEEAISYKRKLEKCEIAFADGDGEIITVPKGATTEAGAKA